MHPSRLPIVILWATAFLTIPIAAQAEDAQYDLVIRNGRIVDGTGSPWFHGDVGICQDRIVAVGKLPTNISRREIDAAGLVVAPGFIDIHSHSDWLLLENGDAHSKIHQGVTTEVLGEGNSAAPRQGHVVPRRVVIDGQSKPIRSFEDYFGGLEESGISVNVASYVGLNNVWEAVMGQSFDRPTAAQLKEMQQLVKQAMREGAFGLSSQIMMPPGSLATTDDLVALCEAVRPYGGIYSTHIRNEGVGVFDAVREAIEIGRRAGVPVDVIHLKIADQKHWGRMADVIELIEEARASGVNVQANVYPYTRGNNNLSSIIPPWAHEGGTAAMLERLRDPSLRPRLKRDIQEGIDGWYNHYTAIGGDWSRMLISADSQYKGLTMDRVIALKSEGQTRAPDPFDILFELLLEHDGSVGTVYAHHIEEDMRLAMAQPWCSIGSDGSALAIEGPLRTGNPHPRNFGTFPRVLGRYVRETGLLRLEEAIWKMTALNATKLGIFDRGLVRPGYFADLALFDPTCVSDRATYEDPFQYGVGVEYVIVNGRLVLEQGRHTGVRSGRALKKTRKPATEEHAHG